MSAAFLPSPEPAKPLTLYAIAEDLVAHLDSLDLLEEGSPERAECEAKIAGYMDKLPERVDAVAAALRSFEAQAQFAKSEIERLRDRKTRFEKRYENLEKYCIRILKAQPEPKKGPRKLEGQHNTMSLRPSEAVVILSEQAIPIAYKSVAVELPAAEWDALVEANPGIVDHIQSRNEKIRAADIKKALKSGTDVAGADIEFRDNLVLK